MPARAEPRDMAGLSAFQGKHSVKCLARCAGLQRMLTIEGDTPGRCVVLRSESVMRWSVLLVPLLVLVLSGCAMNKVAAYKVDTARDYTLDTGDIVRVTVYGDETLTNTYTVTDKGTVAFPLIGQVGARGQTITTLERMITERLAAGYMISPKVSVEVSTYRPFFIEGAVTTAGQYAYVYGMSARAAIATAGGLTEFADRNRVNVYRRVGKSMTKLTIGLDQPILPGDTVVVLERWL